MNLKQRVEKLEQAKNPDTCLVHYVPKVDGEDWSETCASYRLGNDVKESIFLINDDDMEL